MAELHDDPLWPRAGGWPGPDSLPAGGRADLGILGVPAYLTSLSPTNAFATPAAVREALRRYSPALLAQTDHLEYIVEKAQPLGRYGFVDFGDVANPDGAAGEAATIARMSQAVEDAHIVCAIGGDNSITVASALGSYGDDLDRAGLITLDAHFDVRDGISNGSPVRRLVEAGLDPKRIVQIGIADFANSIEYAERVADWGVTVIHRSVFHSRQPAEIMAEAMAIAGSAGGPVHLDIDLDVCDRSVVPACPASLPGGLAAWEVRALVRAAAVDERLRSADIAEVDATADSEDGRTVRLAALCVLELAAGFSLRG